MNYTLNPKEVLIYESKSGKKPFIQWIESLDNVTKGRINNRIIRLSLGHYGDYKSVVKNIKELRFHFGAGYRIYFAEYDKHIIILLSGGNKKTQKRDIDKALAYTQEYEENRYETV